MSGTYRPVLPEVFPYTMRVRANRVGEVSRLLSKTRPGIPNGSSFAITSDTHDAAFRTLWLSEVSHSTIQSLWPETFSNAIPGGDEPRSEHPLGPVHPISTRRTSPRHGTLVRCAAWIATTRSTRISHGRRVHRDSQGND